VAKYLRACSAALLGRRASPSLEAVEAALANYAAAFAAARRERLTEGLSADAVERIFALSFGFEQLHADLVELAKCVDELAKSNSAKAA